MCNRKSPFSELKDIKPIDIVLGDGHVVQAVGIGKVTLMVKITGGTQKCSLNEVLYVPDLAYNLFSISKSTAAGKTAVFDGRNFEIRMDDGRVVATGSRHGSLYHLSLENEHVTYTAGSASEDLWHRRYGHLGEQSLKKLVSDNLVTGLDYNTTKKLAFCEGCVEGKHHRSEFPQSSSRQTEVLGLIHSDVCGKMSKKSLGGAEYFLTFIDDKSRFTWVYFLRTKGEVFEKFQEWQSMVEKASGKKVKVLRSDNGGEYTSHEFQRYLKKEGIRHETTIPKTPEQNGVAERMNRTLVEMARSMLHTMDRKFWAEAVANSVYLRNRSPTTAVPQMTPYEAWNGSKPDVSHLREFGCPCYAHVPKDERKKLDPKAKKCIFLGYGDCVKGYRLYDESRSHVMYSRDVKFDESNSRVVKEESDAGESCKPEAVMDPEKNELEENDENNSTDEDMAEKEEAVELRRSERERREPNKYGEWVTLAADLESPSTYKAAMRDDKSKDWQGAMMKEMKSLNSNKVWDLVPLPAGRKIIGSKWVYKVKVGANGVVERYKARLVAQGFSQKFGLDYDETFCPVVRGESVRAVIALAAERGLMLHQLDVTTAFLNGTLEEEVYMKQPEGFVVDGKEDMVCKLHKSIYGLKQSPRCWNMALDTHLKSIGLQQSDSDPCLYTAQEGEMAIVAVYVDDILIATESEKKMIEVKQCLSQRFDTKDLGELTSFLGVQVKREPGGMWIGQPGYTSRVLEKFNMADCKPVSTPVDTSVKLQKNDAGPEFSRSIYQSAVGCLLYLANWTRPDITFAVSNVARYSADPRLVHWTAVKRILRYLKGTSDYGVKYKVQEGEIFGHCDADWAGDVNDRKSTSGYVFSMSGSPVSWRSKKQSCVALSTAEAEYVALAAAAQEAIWLRNLMEDLKGGNKAATVIHDDSQAAISMSKNPQFHGKGKHIEIKYHYIREQVLKGNVVLKYCPTENMLADILTKGLNREQHEKLRKQMNVVRC